MVINEGGIHFILSITQKLRQVIEKRETERHHFVPVILAASESEVHGSKAGPGGIGILLLFGSLSGRHFLPRWQFLPTKNTESRHRTSACGTTLDSARLQNSKGIIALSHHSVSA